MGPSYPSNDKQSNNVVAQTRRIHSELHFFLLIVIAICAHPRPLVISGYSVTTFEIVPSPSASMRAAAATATLMASPRPEILRESTGALASTASFPSEASCASTPLRNE